MIDPEPSRPDNCAPESSPMRCPQCGLEVLPDATFCSRCGTRVHAIKPQDKREYAVTRIRPSWWRFARGFMVAAALLLAAIALAREGRRELTGAALVLGAIVALLVVIAQRGLGWSLTSERLVENRGILATRRRELELADIRSVEVSRRLSQRLLGLGDVTVASAASTDFAIRLEDVAAPDSVADTIRRARLRRLA